MCESDIKLLNLAAKACGLNVKGWRVDADDNFEALLVGPKFTKRKKAWNPLTDDGDALRLAVTLDIFFRPEFALQLHEARDSLEDTRRAFVCAAATIGETRP